MKLLTYLKKFDLLDRVKKAAGDEFYNLDNWSFKINYRAKSRYGCSKASLKLIEITSEYYIHGGIKEGEYVDFINTLLHETAHAIVSERYGRYRFGEKIKAHGNEWNQVMRDLGITKIKRCGKSTVLDSVKTKSKKHRYDCKDCDYTFESQRALIRMEQRTHKGCGNKEHGGHFTHTQLR